MGYEENKVLGYVWLYRSVSGHYACDKDNDHFRLWCELIIQSAHQEGRAMMFSGKKISLDKGQLITGRDVLARKTHIHRSKVERILNFFENEQQIEQLKTAHGRLITVNKLKEYHSFEQQDKQPVSNQRATNEQPVSTNNKGNKEDKEKNTTIYSSSFEKFWKLYPRKESKKKAFDIWKRHSIEESLSEILVFIGKATTTDRWRGGYVPQPTTFLNGERWNDELKSYEDSNKPKHFKL